MTIERSVLFLGLRRSPLEWQAEIDAAAEQGYAVHVHSETSLSHTGLPQEQTAAFSWVDSAEEIAAQTVEQVRRVGHVPAAVTCWGDRYVGVTAQVAEVLGLRGPGAEAAAICGDKAAQRQALEPHGLNPKWRTGSTSAELCAAIEELGLPLIFKLAHSSGGRGSALIDETTDPDTLLKATSLNYLDSDAFVVEEYIEGSEHSVTGLVRDGEVVTLAVSDKVLGAGDLRTTATVVPSALAPELVAQLHTAARSAVRAVGLRSGGFHVDLRLGASGPVVLEVGGRLGGDLINSHLVPIATGGRTQPYRSLIEVLAGGPLPEPASFVTTVAMLVLPVSEGAGDKALDQVAEHPAVRAVADWTTPGAPAVAVVVTVQDADEVPALTTELRTWIEK